MTADEATLRRVYETLFGNGKPGIVQQVEEMRRDMYHNKDTGEQGMVADVREVKNTLKALNAVFKFIAFVLSLGVGGYLFSLLAHTLGMMHP